MEVDEVAEAGEASDEEIGIGLESMANKVGWDKVMEIAARMARKA